MGVSRPSAVRAIVAGAGIVGVACARALARRGAEVTIVEPGLLGGGATAASMGHLVVMDASDAQLELTRWSQELWREEYDALPGDVELDVCGTFWVAADDADLDEARRKAERLAERGIAAEIVGAERVREVEPSLRPGLAGGLRVPGDAVIYPPCAVRHVLEQARSLGATLVLGDAVRAWSGRAARLRSGRDLDADVLVVASGVAARELSPGAPVRPRKGHLVITDRHAGFLRHQTLEIGYSRSVHGADSSSVAFNVQPRPTGQLLIGSSRQLGVAALDVERDVLARMTARAIEFLPGLARLTALRAWTGLRAATPDGLPIIGPDPQAPGLYLACGHEGLGITMSLGTAELIAAHIAGDAAPIAIEPFLPCRFARSASHV